MPDPSDRHGRMGVCGASSPRTVTPAVAVVRCLFSLIRRLDAILAVTCLSAMVLIVLAQIMLRNFFQTGIEGSDYLVRHLVLWVVFLGAGIASRENRHIHIDLFPRFLSPTMTRVSEFMVLGFSLTVLGVLCYASVRFVMMEYESGVRLPLLDVPIWMAEAIIPLGYALIAFYFLILGILRLCGRNAA